MGKNIGKLLLDRLENRFGKKATIQVVSDPNATSFYEKFGYRKVGEVKSKPDGRKLPLLKKKL